MTADGGLSCGAGASDTMGVACDVSAGALATGDASTGGSMAGAGSVRRRMRAVTGSSAAMRRACRPLGRGVDGVGGFQGLDPLGQFGNGRACRARASPATARP